MKKRYRVIFHLVHSVDYEVKAKDEKQAEDLASEWFSKEYRDTEMEVDEVSVEEIPETPKICKICGLYEDDDGRCGCTNKDAK